MALTQILTTDSVSASVVNTKIVEPANTAISGLQIAQTAGGTGTAITLTGVELTNGYQKTFVINANNSGAATTINGKPLYKPGGIVAPSLTAGKAATVWYNLSGDCFFIKASAEGTAVAGDVLAGLTFSNDNDIGLTGTLALTGTAVASDILATKTAYNTDPKTKITGTLVIPHGYQSYTTPGTYTFTIPENVTKITFIVRGGGGGGGNQPSSWGGAAGGTYIQTITVTPLSTLPVVVGTGGSYSNPGGTGGNSSLSTYVATGGTGGSTSSPYGGIGGTGGGFGGTGSFGSNASGNNGAGGMGDVEGFGAGGKGNTGTIGTAGGNGRVIIIW